MREHNFLFSTKAAYIPAIVVAGKCGAAMLLQVPLFISAGEKIKVDTRTNAYLSRASS